jgi:hypothetical protein
MTLHLFRDGDSDVFAFTVDRTGHNLPCTQESEWRFMETLDGVEFAWGEENFGEVYSALAAAGFYLFEGDMQVYTARNPGDALRKRGGRPQSRTRTRGAR